METTARTIGLLGGSFDPVHFGHLALADAALATGIPDEVWFVPTARSPFKPDGAFLSDDLRVQLLRLALDGKNRQSLCLEDLDHPGVSYTDDLLARLRAKHPGLSFVFLVGADSLATLHRWHNAEALVRSCRFLSFGRRGSVIAADSLGFDADTASRLLADFHPTFDCPVSSTLVRAALREGRSLEGLVPPAVARALANPSPTP